MITITPNTGPSITSTAPTVEEAAARYLDQFPQHQGKSIIAKRYSAKAMFVAVEDLRFEVRA